MTEKSWYALRNLVYSGEFTQAEALLREDSSLRHATNGIGETVMHFLAVENDLRGVRWLYNKGFSIDVKNEFGTPLLFEVAQLGYRELLLWLKSMGADFSATEDREGLGLIEYLEEHDSHKGLAIIREILGV